MKIWNNFITFITYLEKFNINYVDNSLTNTAL